MSKEKALKWLGEWLGKMEIDNADILHCLNTMNSLLDSKKIENEYMKQAREIIKNNGKCPNNVLCCDCVFIKVNKTVSGCSRFYALETAQKYINKST